MILGDMITSMVENEGLSVSFMPSDLNLSQISVSGLCLDSRKVKQGDLFFALSGAKSDGAKFAKTACEQGAVAVVAQQGAEGLDGLDCPVFYSDAPRLLLAKMARMFFKAQPATMVAVTGTAGKTSVASFLRQIWDLAGFPAAMVGTTGVTAPNRVEYGSLTTPDPVTLNQLLAELANDGVTHCAMEASSHGLDQYRLDGVDLAAAAFTNLGRDHMDYHPTVAHYMNAKMALFERVLPKGSPAVIFADDEWSDRAIECAKKAGHRVLTVGYKGEYLTLKRVEQRRQDQRAEIHIDDEIYFVDLPLAGDFQLSNALVAAGLAMSTGTQTDVVMDALSKLKGASGRLELVGVSKDACPVYVDYAHKPDALEHVLASVKPFTTGRLVLVFGCGGDRDKGKRPIMGEIASRLSDIVIVTDDNPRSENRAQIRAEILAAAPNAIEIADRSQAIETAIDMLESGDTLIVAGKGHEEGQIIGDVTLPFSDHAEIRQSLDGQLEDNA